MNISRQEARRHLKGTNALYGDLAKDAFAAHDPQVAMRYGKTADTHGEALIMLNNGATVEEVNEEYNGILEI